jgi:hypothetical protein
MPVLTKFITLLAGITLCICWQQTYSAVVLDYSTSSHDIPSQRQALLELYAAAGQNSFLGERTGGLDESELSGNGPWGSNTSYCSWWGVSCCGHQLRDLPGICNEGVFSINTLQLAGTELNGTLPDVFKALPDLQLLNVAYNPGGWSTKGSVFGAWQQQQQQQQQQDTCACLHMKTRLKAHAVTHVCAVYAAKPAPTDDNVLRCVLSPVCCAVLCCAGLQR